MKINSCAALFITISILSLGCSDDPKPPPPPQPSGIAIGWIGGGQDGWQMNNGAASGVQYQDFNQPTAVCVDNNGNIYAADFWNYRISKWDSNGNAVGWIGGGQNGWQTGNSPSVGASDYQSFNQPRGVSIDSNGNIFVADDSNDRISKWDSNGNAVGWIGGGQNGWQIGNAPSAGMDYQSFNNPRGVYIDNSGTIFIADAGNYRISKWDSIGNAVGWIGGGNGWNTTTSVGIGTGYQSFWSPSNVFVDTSGNIFVADSNNNRISKWDSAGNAIGWIGGGQDGWQIGNAPSSGRDYQSFYDPRGVSVGSNGNIYVADHENSRISKWTSAGLAAGWIGAGENGWKTRSHNWQFDPGWDYQNFHFPEGVHVSSIGHIFVADRINNRISKWQD